MAMQVLVGVLLGLLLAGAYGFWRWVARSEQRRRDEATLLRHGLVVRPYHVMPGGRFDAEVCEAAARLLPDAGIVVPLVQWRARCSDRELFVDVERLQGAVAAYGCLRTGTKRDRDRVINTARGLFGMPPLAAD